MDAAFLDLSASLDGYVVWLDAAPLVRTRTLDEARKAYRAALALATEAREQLNRTLGRV